MDRKSDDYILLLTASQTPLYAFIRSLIFDQALAHDVLQETNLTLWNKADEFEEGTSFLAWACRIARYHVLNAQRKARRDRLLFDDQVLMELSERQLDRVDEIEVHAKLLHRCLDELPPERRSLLVRRYGQGESVNALAAELGKSAGAISQLLYRLREHLLNCVTRRIQEGQA